jgi:hypothetical protein
MTHPYMTSPQFDAAHAIEVMSYVDASSDIAPVIVVMSYMDMSSDDTLSDVEHIIVVTS